MLRALGRLLWGLGLLSFDTLLRSAVKYKPANVTLVVRLDNIGDFVVFNDALATLRREVFPASHGRLILLANPSWAAWAAELYPDIEVWAVDGRLLFRHLF